VTYRIIDTTNTTSPLRVVSVDQQDGRDTSYSTDGTNKFVTIDHVDTRQEAIEWVMDIMSCSYKAASACVDGRGQVIRSHPQPGVFNSYD